MQSKIILCMNDIMILHSHSYLDLASNVGIRSINVEDTYLHLKILHATSDIERTTP